MRPMRKHLYWPQSCLISLKRLSISVDDATHVWLKVLAAKQGTTINSLVVTAVKEHLTLCGNVAPNSASKNNP